MNKQTLIVIVGAAILLGLGIFGSMAFSGGDDSTPSMTMPDGSTMPSDQMTNTSDTDNGTTTGMDMTP